MEMTDKTIKALPKLEIDKYYNDSGSSGLYLFVRADGGMAWKYRWRTSAKSTKTVHLGAYPNMSIEQARAFAIGATVTRKNGGDVEEFAQANAVNASITLDKAAKRWLKDAHKRGLRAADKHYRDYERHFSKPLGDRAINTIRFKHIAPILDALVAQGKDSTANNAQRIMSRIFRQALNDDEVEISPMIGRRLRGKESTRDRVLTDDELRSLWGATEGNHMIARAVRYQLLTGQRATQCAKLRRSYVDLKEGVILYPADIMKMKRPHSLPITDAMREVIGELQSVFVFPKRGVYDDGINIESMWAFLKPFGYGTHDIRRTVATRLMAIGVEKRIAQRVLSHGTQGDTFDKHYDRHSYLPEKRKALTLWQENLMQIVKP